MEKWTGGKRKKIKTHENEGAVRLGLNAGRRKKVRGRISVGEEESHYI